MTAHNQVLFLLVFCFVFICFVPYTPRAQASEQANTTIPIYHFQSSLDLQSVYPFLSSFSSNFERKKDSIPST